MKWSKKIENFLYDGKKTAENTGFMPLCGCAPAALKLLLEEGRTLCVTLPEAQSADRFHTDISELMRMLGIERKVLTIPECGRGKLLFPGGEARRARALNRILNEKFDLVIGSVHAFLGPAPCPQESEDGQLELRAGMEISPLEIVTKLVQLDYDDEAMVTIAGEFSRRGGILDIFSPAHDEPCRIEFFDNEIESIRFFDPETQRSTRQTECCRIINRAGITAGGAADSDAFAYMEKSGKFRILNIFPDAGEELLAKYSVPGAPERWQELNTRVPNCNFYELDMPGAENSPLQTPFAAETGSQLPDAVPKKPNCCKSSSSAAGSPMQ